MITLFSFSFEEVSIFRFQWFFEVIPLKTFQTVLAFMVNTIKLQVESAGYLRQGEKS